MRKRSSAGIAIARFAVCLAMALFVGAESVLARSVSLDLRNKAPAGAKMRLASVATSGTDGTLRSFNLDAGVADVGEVAVGDRLAFTLFDDVAVTVTLAVD